MTLLTATAQGSAVWQGEALAGDGNGQYCFFRLPEHLPVTLVVEAATADGTRVAALDIGGRAILRLAGATVRDLRVTRPAGRTPAVYEGALAFDPESGRARLSARLGDECRLEGLEVVLAAVPQDADHQALASAATTFAALLAARERASSGEISEAARDIAVALADENAVRPVGVGAALARVVLAQIAIDIGDGERVSRLLSESGAVLQQALAPPHPALFYFDHIVARQLFIAGDFAGSARLRERLLDWPTAAVPALHPDRLGNDIGLAAVALQRGRADEGLAQLERTLPRAQAALGDLHPVTIWGELNRAYALDLNGRPGEASRRMLELHGQSAARYGPAHPITLQLLIFLSDFEAAAGRPHAARVAAERALAYYDSTLGPGSLLTIAARERVAYLYEQLFRYDDARALQRELVRDLSARVGDTHPRTLRAMQNLAILEGLQGRDGEALRLAMAVRQAFGQRYGDDDPQTRWAVLTLGFAHLKARDSREGCRLLVGLAEATRQQMALLELRQNALLGVAQCRIAAEDAQGALDTLHEAQALFRQRKMDDAETVAMINGMQALALLRLDRADEARTLLEAMVGQAEATRREEAPQSSGGRAHFGQQVADREYAAGYRDLALLYARQGRTVDAIRVAELARGRDLADALQVPLASGADGIADRARLTRAERMAALVDIDAEIALAPPASVERTRLAVRRQEIAEEIALARPDGEVAARADSGLDLDAARRRIAPGTVFIGLVSVRDTRFAYVLRRDTEPTLALLPASAHLDRVIAAWRAASSVANPRLAPVWRAPDGTFVVALTAPVAGAVRVSAAQLRGMLERALIRPLARHLAGARRIEFAADGPLATLPFEALWHDGRPLIARYEVSYVPSLAVRDALARRPQAPHTLDLVAFGAPDYRRLAPQRSGAGPLIGVRWPALPGAAGEVDAVARDFASARTTRFVGADATKRNFVAAHRSGLLVQTRLLHVAAHGFLSAAAPQWSALALAGDDGSVAYVTAAELATFRLAADLVVLSACETALGREVAGEALYGLPYALTIAGARATVLTLWPVADAPTVEFMRRFYARLARGVAATTALAATKRDFLRHPQYSAPAYWAPFVLYGGQSLGSTGEKRL